MALTLKAVVALTGKQLKWTSSEFIEWAGETYGILPQRLMVRYRSHFGCTQLEQGVDLAASFCDQFEICSLDDIDILFARYFVVRVPYAPTFGELCRSIALLIDAPTDAVKLRLPGAEYYNAGPISVGVGRWFGAEEAMLPPTNCLDGLDFDMGYRIVDAHPDAPTAADEIGDFGLPDLPNSIIRSMLTCTFDMTGVLAQFKMDQPYYQLRVPGRFELLYVRKTKTVVIRMMNPQRLRALFREHMDVFFSETSMMASISSNIFISDHETYRGPGYIMHELQTHMQYRGKQPLEIVCAAQDWTLRRLLAHVAPLGLLYCSNRAAVIEDHLGVRSCMVHTSARDAERFPDLVQHAAKVFQFTSNDNMPMPVDASAYCSMKDHALSEFMRHLPMVSLPTRSLADIDLSKLQDRA